MYKAPNIDLHWSIGPTFGKLIYDIMMLGLHKDVLEIGSHNGYSTSSFIQALNDGCDFNLSICDVKIPPKLYKVVESCKNSINIIKGRSESAISSKFDFIFVDGNHAIVTVGRELQLMLEHKTKTILFHDINLYYKGNSNFFGSYLLKQVMESHRDYFYLEYKDPIPKDVTHLGMGLATRDKEFFLIASDIFQKIGRSYKLL